MKTPFATFSEMLNLPRQEAARLSALISSDTFDKLVDESERVELRERADMVVQIEKLTEQRDNDHAPYKKFIKAQQDLEAAQARHKEMMGAVMAAHCELQRVGYGYESQINMLEQTLQRGSDPRLKQLVFVLDQQQNPVRRAFAARPQYEMTWGGRKHSIQSNAEAVGLALTAIRDCMTRCRGLQLAAISRKDVTAVLTEMCRELAPILGALHIQGPRIVDGEVSAP